MKNTRLKSYSFVADGKGGSSVQEFPVPDIPADGLLMTVEMCGICGGDPYIFRGGHPHSKYPLVMGHEMIGRVAAIGKEAARERGLKEGDRFVVEVMIPCARCEWCRRGAYNLCTRSEQYGVSRPATDGIAIWGGYGNYIYIDPRSLTHKVPGDVPVERAVTIAVLANAVRWTQVLGKVGVGDVVGIQGPGAQGLCSTVVAKHLGAEVILLGIQKDRSRMELGRALGADHLVLVDEGSPVEAVQHITSGHMLDVCLENSGAAAAAALGLKLLRPRGRYVLSGYTGDREIAIPKDEIPKKELEVIGGWGQAYGFGPSVRIIAEGRYPLERLVTDRFTLETAAQGIEKTAAGTVGLKGVVVPPKV
ncbi:MAG: alcohol dehydrogenase catalytic domain-containing protein [Planctomycetes bacterium]|nr:alcohol dehydrogenase catalytic domain-containing protein [Planctomycetota bacterium]